MPARPRAFAAHVGERLGGGAGQASVSFSAASSSGTPCAMPMPPSASAAWCVPSLSSFDMPMLQSIDRERWCWPSASAACLRLMRLGVPEARRRRTVCAGARSPPWARQMTVRGVAAPSSATAAVDLRRWAGPSAGTASTTPSRATRRRHGTASDEECVGIRKEQRGTVGAWTVIGIVPGKIGDLVKLLGPLKRPWVLFFIETGSRGRHILPFTRP